MSLDRNPALRVLRAELGRLEGWRVELEESAADPSIPAGVVDTQLRQIAGEITLVIEAIHVLEEHRATKVARGAA